MTPLPPPGPVAVLLSGTVGVGKTTAADAIGTLLAERAVPHAIVDLDEIRRFWPTRPDDPFGGAVALRNLTAVARTYTEAGARVLVLAGVVETRDERDRYAEAVGIPLRVCRLVLDLATVRARLAVRHADDEDDRAWHLNRSGELDAILAAAGVEDVVVSTAGRNPAAVAAAVLEAVGPAGDVPGSADVGAPGAPQPEQAEHR